MWVRWGGISSPIHVYHECTLTANWNIKCPASSPKEWRQNILSRLTLLNKLKLTEKLVTLYPEQFPFPRIAPVVASTVSSVSATAPIDAMDEVSSAPSSSSVLYYNLWNFQVNLKNLGISLSRVVRQICSSKRVFCSLNFCQFRPKAIVFSHLTPLSRHRQVQLQMKFVLFFRNLIRGTGSDIHDLQTLFIRPSNPF